MVNFFESGPDGRINKNRTAKNKQLDDRTAEFDQTAEYLLATVPSHYIITNKLCRNCTLIY